MNSLVRNLFLVLSLAVLLEAFSSSSFSGSQLQTSVQNGGSSSLSMEYIPSGMSKKEWAKLKDKEKQGKKGNLGKSGITSFQSRSFDDWQKAGGKNLFPVDPKKAKSLKDVPYMQRKGGSADDGDLKPKKKAGLFDFLKKKEPEPEPEPKKKQNPWTF
mmetsp:Transcript_28862/g.33193  ORF Transcript_28862/g.33193 Transcript_28862/m.33193 type:complete len:158 (+) Transcript_28862:160-633(+)|eukprot:CAMPEP_0194367838 /NCGR_PEP_ID=MMETSP0174-20130528/16013_1 /TAXON_ID=216777 /ORGANISM="Proboscia alata, Strain PI-D3" /LENGTH=157 /DNA_ID=CAMNT_0039143879 /DNA_START=151 /DNA_END=624 /DNA_ORIENTATION=+